MISVLIPDGNAWKKGNKLIHLTDQCVPKFIFPNPTYCVECLCDTVICWVHKHYGHKMKNKLC